MKPAPFEFVQPRTVEDAVRALAGCDGVARVMAGGQSLVPMLNLRLAPLERVVDVSRIEQLRAVEDRPDAVLLGACVTHAAIEDGRTPDPTPVGLLRRIAGGIAYRAVRNRGTIGGSVALADPSADWVTTMIALDARIEAIGPDGRRSIPAAEFIHGAYMTALADDELLYALTLPRYSAAAHFGHYKMCRKTGEYASSLALAAHDPQRGYSRVVLGATGGAPLQLARTAALLATGERWSDALRDRVVQAFEEDSAARRFDGYEQDIHRASVIAAVQEALQQ
ncbi:MAG: FAD binding domain-containing protein [Burkholderiaceae bacterium]